MREAVGQRLREQWLTKGSLLSIFTFLEGPLGFRRRRGASQGMLEGRVGREGIAESPGCAEKMEK